MASILGFLVWWPIGLALLLLGLGRRSMGCRRYRRWAMAQGPDSSTDGERWSPPWAGWGFCCGTANTAPASGNRAFDEYRADTLRRLEEEQKEFATFLERLRFAKDKAEFDQFMAERRQPPQPPTEPPADPTQG
ncbi:MAG: DUF2852 domain-containing protein [Rhodospirillales bacterium]|nr:DUF2852 domain-containing protein [Rhodospirillales bacterium]